MARTRRPQGTGRTISTGWSTPESEEPAGHEQLGAAPAGAGRAAPEEPERESRAPRRPVLLGGAIVLLLALVLALPPLLLGGATAERTAARFLQAVLDGDARTVREHITADDGALDIALTDEVFAAAPARAESYSIDHVSIEGDSAEVTASLSDGEDTLETTLHLERERQGLLRRATWVLQPVTLPVLRLQVPVGSERLVVNGQEVEIPEEQHSEEAFGLSPLMLRVVPGTFEISTVPTSDRFSSASVLVTAPPVLGSWASPPVQIGYELTETGEQQLGSDLIASLEDCARSTSPRPHGCPFAAPREVTGSGTWELIGEPEAAHLASDGEIFAVRVTGTAAFTVAADGAVPEPHEVQIDATVAAIPDRDGALAPQWFFEDPGGVVANCTDGESTTGGWSAEGTEAECGLDG